MKNKAHIIGLVGPKGVGKTTFAQDIAKQLDDSLHVEILSFADPIRAMAEAMGVDTQANTYKNQKNPSHPKISFHNQIKKLCSCHTAPKNLRPQLFQNKIQA